MHSSKNAKNTARGVLPPGREGAGGKPALQDPLDALLDTKSQYNIKITKKVNPMSLLTTVNNSFYGVETAKAERAPEENKRQPFMRGKQVPKGAQVRVWNIQAKGASMLGSMSPPAAALA